MASLSVIVPTYNEAENIQRLVERVHTALAGTDYELIVVDDSVDGTQQVLADLARFTPWIHVFHRDGRRGLASAVVDGIAAAQGSVVCVLDADLQHPPETLPLLTAALERSGADLAVASRYVPGGRYVTFEAWRRVVSRVATRAAQILLHRARRVADPLSGFFAFRRTAVRGVRLRPVGYKILLEILVRGNLSRVVEVPYSFEIRSAGQSKLTPRQHWEYLQHLCVLAGGQFGNLRSIEVAVLPAPLRSGASE
ncbi:MAG TPA: polyprenol monophosphomannose synthase [bacterium]|nr:polyprenol monophosphomannose synthase [bacterium]